MKRWAIAALMMLAAALRLRQYLANRSLWLDEAMLSLNIIHRNFAQLWQPPAYLPHPALSETLAASMHQAAPIGFLGIEKWAVETFGTSEYALRLFPLLAGIASISLFYLLAKRVVKGGAVPLALALFALSPALIYYASEVKQYSSDMAIGLLLLDLAVTERVMLLGIVGAIAIWFSHSAVFVVGGVSGVLLLKHWRNWKALVSCTVWVTSFAVCYFLLLRPLSRDATMVGYWQQYFMPFPPNLKWFKDSFFQLFYSGALDFIGLAALVFLCGCVSVWARNREALLLLLSPMLLTLVAASLHMYPFGGRLLLFLVPVVLLFMAEGAEAIRSVAGSRFGVIVLALLLIDPGLYVLHKFVSPFNRTDRVMVPPLEEMRPLMAQLRPRLQAGDVVYVYQYAQPAFEYYAERITFPSEKVVMGVAGGENPHRYETDLAGFAGKRVWVVTSDVSDDVNEPGYLKFYMNEKGNRLESVTFSGVEADLYGAQP